MTYFKVTYDKILSVKAISSKNSVLVIACTSPDVSLMCTCLTLISLEKKKRFSNSRTLVIVKQTVIEG